jgi:hypothetical protein
VLTVAEAARPAAARHTKHLDACSVMSREIRLLQGMVKSRLSRNRRAGCPNTDIYVLRTLPKNALGILLAAKVSGSPIRIAVNDTQCDSSTGRPIANEVGIQ